MATVLQTEETQLFEPETRTVLHGIEWRTYIELRENPANYNLRMTYDQGTLEIMAPSIAHGRYGNIIAQAIQTWAKELRIPIVCLGDLTCNRSDLEKGFEPDHCFYVQNEPRMWQKMELDLATDPPPDLAIEIEMSRSAMKKIASIYAAFGVPEVWRFDGKNLYAYEFAEGEYQIRESSLCFPRLRLRRIEELARQVGHIREMELIDGFAEWVRKAVSR